jgi:tetratricopeptide (TPR) repeat protein
LQYEKELEENPNDIHIHKTLAKMYMREWDTNDDESNIDYKKALEHLLVINESNTTSAIEEAIGTCYYNLNRYKEAIEYYKKDADNNSYYMMAKSYYYLNAYNNAIESYSRLIGSNINDAAIERMICIYILQNNIEGLRDVVTKYTNKYNNTDYELSTDKYISIDRSDIIDFYKLINEGDIDKAKRLLNNKNDDIARFYKCIFILLENTNIENRANKFMDVYKDIDNNILKDYIENLGDDEIKYHEMNNYNKNSEKPIQD